MTSSTPRIIGTDHRPLPKDLSSFRPRPSEALPTIRLLLHPRPGIGLDARLPFTHHVRCFTSLESYFRGQSAVRFGLELVRFPLRLELTPSVRLSLRPSLLRVSFYNFICTGLSFTFFDNARSPSHPPLLSEQRYKTWDLAWPVLRPFLAGIFELHQRNTVLGTMIDPRLRGAARDAVRKAIERADGSTRRKRKVPNPTQVPSLPDYASPPMDPRKGSSPNELVKERLERRLSRLAETEAKTEAKIETEPKMETDEQSAVERPPTWPGVSRDDDAMINDFRNKLSKAGSAAPGLPAGSRTREPCKIIGTVKMGKDGNPVIVRDGADDDDDSGEGAKQPPRQLTSDSFGSPPFYPNGMPREPKRRMFGETRRPRDPSREDLLKSIRLMLKRREMMSGR